MAQKIPKIDPELLVTALTHKSFATENNVESYERLEFLGDSVLSFIITSELFTLIPDQEKVLSTMRSSLVSRRPLANQARKLGLDSKILLGNGKILTEGAKNENILEDVFEAFIGAIYLSAGLDKTREFVLNIFNQQLSDIKNDLENDKLNTSVTEFDPKSQVITLARELHFGEPIYTYQAVGDESDLSHICELTFSKSELFSVREHGKTKKEASKNAAREAVKKLRSFSKI